MHHIQRISFIKNNNKQFLGSYFPPYAPQLKLVEMARKPLKRIEILSPAITSTYEKITNKEVGPIQFDQVSLHQ